MTIPKVYARDGMVVCAYEGNAMTKAYTPDDAAELADRLLRVVMDVRQETAAVRRAERERIKRDVAELFKQTGCADHASVLRAIDGEA